MDGSKTMTVRFDPRDIEVPAQTIADAGIREGDDVVIEAVDGEVVVRRRTASEEIDDEIVSGGTERFESGEAFLAALELDLKPLQE
jgi:bifunctional DNA-binding transcriptional regulator/antitoxin component of YhaV-PrlF toxin-antitoxin module